MVTSMSLALLGTSAATTADAPASHLLESDDGFMIGRWVCHATRAGMPDREIRVDYEWAYGRSVLRENMSRGAKLIGEFLTTCDKVTSRFKGVGVGA